MNNSVNGKEATPAVVDKRTVAEVEAGFQAAFNEIVVQKNMLTDRAINLSVQLQAAQKQVTDLQAELALAKQEITNLRASLPDAVTETDAAKTRPGRERPVTRKPS